MKLKITYTPIEENLLPFSSKAERLTMDSEGIEIKYYNDYFKCPMSSFREYGDFKEIKIEVINE